MAKKTQKVVKLDSERAVRNDGWANTLTGMGQLGRDKRLSNVAVWEPIVEQDIEQLYGVDDMAAKIVDEPVDQAFKNSFDFTGISRAKAEALKTRLESEGFVADFMHAWKTARLFGGAGLLLISDDMSELDEPLADDAEILGVTVLNRFELFSQYTDLQKDITKPNFGLPRRYLLMPRTSTSDRSRGEAIDASRIIRFDGVHLTSRLRVMNNYWHDSVLNRCRHIIRDYSAAFEAASLVVQDFSVAKYKLKNLADLVASSEGKNMLLERMNIANMVRSIARAMIVDADGEDFEYQTRNVAGMKDVLEKIEDRLVAATKFPHTVLLGRSPNGGGLAEGGDHELTNWYDYIKSQQVHYAAPKLVQLGKMFLREDGVDAPDLGVTFRPLTVMSEKDSAAMRYSVAQTDQIYFNMGALDAEEVTESRWGGDEYSIETEVDWSLRKPGGRLDPDAEPELPAAPLDPKTGKPMIPAVPVVTKSVASRNDGTKKKTTKGKKK